MWVYAAGAPVGMGTSPHQVFEATLTLFQPGGQIMPSLYWCPHQVLKATGAPDLQERILRDQKTLQTSRNDRKKNRNKE